MKDFIYIKSCKWAPGSTKEMIYEDNKGRTFIGPRKEIVLNELVGIEKGEGKENGHIPIIKFL